MLTRDESLTLLKISEVDTLSKHH